MPGWRFGRIVVLALGALAAMAVAAKPVGDYNRYRYTAADGLPHDLVTALAQTPDGFLWVGTYEGLARFNGARVEVFRPTDTPALGDAAVRELQVGADGTLLVTTARGGVALLREGRWSAVEATRDLPQAVTTAWKDGDGRLLIGFENGEVWRLVDGRRDRAWRLPSDGEINGFLLDAERQLWVAARGGLVRLFDDGRVVPTMPAEGLPAGAVNALLRDAEGRLFVGASEGVFVGGSRGFRLLHPGLAGVSVRSLALAPDGSLLIGTLTRGLLQLMPAGELNSVSNDVVGNDRVTRLLTDREGNIWAGTPTGLERLADLPFINIGARQGLDDGYVRSVLEVADGSVLIGGSGGLYRWQANRVTPLRDAAGDPLDSVLSLAVADGGGVWIGTYTQGVWRLATDGALHRDPRSDQLPAGSEIRGLLDLGPEGLWVAASTGVFHWQGEQVIRYTAAEGLPASYGRRLLRTRDGRLWVTTMRGLAVFDGRRFRAVDIAGPNGADNSFGLHEASDGALWIATGRGLRRLKDGRVGSVTVRHGLPTDTLFEVVEDVAGDLWVTSNAGISRLPRGDVERVADGADERIPVLTLGARAGMASSLASGGAGVAAFRHSRTDEIWIGTAHGVSRFAPERVTETEALPPPVVLEQVAVDGEPVLPVDGVLRVPAGSRRVEIFFSSPMFRSIGALHYRYRLIGVDDRWQLTPRDLPVAAYTHLPPGHFGLEIEASVDREHWSPGRLQLGVEQLPAWWQQPMLRYGLPLLLLVLVGMAVGWRIHGLQVRQRRVEALVEERTAALQASNAQLEDLNRLMRAQSAVFRAQASTDPLTGLPNRRAFEQAVDALIADDRAFVLGLVDVDHFKRINDRFSHAVGDEVLAGVASLLRDVMGMGSEARPDRPLVARWGGEEFALLWPETTLAEAVLAAERLRATVASRDWGERLGGEPVTVSLGLAERLPGEAIGEVFRLADQKLYLAKHDGRNRVVR